MAGIYLLIPSVEHFKYATSASCSNLAMQRFIINRERWKQWWPGQQKNEHTFSYNSTSYRIDKILLNGFEATAFDKKDSVKGSVHIFAGDNNTVDIKWESVFFNSGNPVAKIINYSRNKNFQSGIRSLLQDMKRFFDDEKNIYGFTASVQKVTDEFLINVKQPMDHYPDVKEIYSLVTEIKNYIHQKGGIEKNPPMLNVYNESPGVYQLMVAIPTTTALPEEGKFLYRQMVLGNILVADITGGPYTIAKAEQEIKYYITDHQKTSPAIPYQSLVTDRSVEKDTAKWQTRLYYPVFY